MLLMLKDKLLVDDSIVCKLCQLVEEVVDRRGQVGEFVEIPLVPLCSLVG